MYNSSRGDVLREEWKVQQVEEEVEGKRETVKE